MVKPPKQLFMVTFRYSIWWQYWNIGLYSVQSLGFEPFYTIPLTRVHASPVGRRPILSPNRIDLWDIDEVSLYTTTMLSLIVISLILLWPMNYGNKLKRLQIWLFFKKCFTLRKLRINPPAIGKIDGFDEQQKSFTGCDWLYWYPITNQSSGIPQRLWNW